MATIELPTREAWLAERRNGLGASDVSAALGINPWKSQFALWAEKCGLLPDEDLAASNEAIEWGTRLEVPVGEAFAERTGRKVVHQGWASMHVHPDLPFLRSSLDFVQVKDGDEGALETKTTSAWNSDDWSGGATPLYYQTQLQTQLAVCGYQFGSIAVLIGGQRLLYRDMQRDDAFIAAMLPALERFWQHVQDKTPPAIDSSPATARILQKLNPLDSGMTVELPAEAMDWHNAMEDAKAKIKALEEIAALNKNRLIAAIADATFGQLSDGSRYSYKTQTRAAHEVKESSFRVLRRAKS